MDPQQTTSFNALTALNLRVKVVDIGANPIDGSPPYAALLKAGNADVVGFEPNPEALAKLNEMKGPYRPICRTPLATESRIPCTFARRLA